MLEAVVVIRERVSLLNDDNSWYRRARLALPARRNIPRGALSVDSINNEESVGDSYLSRCRIFAFRESDVQIVCLLARSER